MKRKFSKILLAVAAMSWFPTTLWAETDPATMVLNTTEGQTYTFLLSDDIVITYSGSDMLIKGEGVETAFGINDVFKFYFTGDLTGQSGINDVSVGPDMSFRYIVPNVYEVSGDSLTGVTVVDMAGHTVVARKADSPVIIDLNGMADGVYLVTVQLQNSSQTLKIIKK